MKRLQQDKHLELTTQGMCPGSYPIGLFGTSRPAGFPTASGGYPSPYGVGGVNPYQYPYGASSAAAAASYSSSQSRAGGLGSYPGYPQYAGSYSSLPTLPSTTTATSQADSSVSSSTLQPGLL